MWRRPWRRGSCLWARSTCSTMGSGVSLETCRRPREKFFPLMETKNWQELYLAHQVGAHHGCCPPTGGEVQGGPETGPEHSQLPRPEILWVGVLKYQRSQPWHYLYCSLYVLVSFSTLSLNVIYTCIFQSVFITEQMILTLLLMLQNKYHYSTFTFQEKDTSWVN